MPAHQTNDTLIISTTAERVDLARRTHAAVNRSMYVFFGVLAAAILVIGLLLAMNDRGSFVGTIVVAVCIAAVPFLMAAANRKTERKAERFLASDGVTQFVAGPASLTVADTVVPYERITGLFANTEKEVYSTGRGNGVGGKIGTAQRRKLFTDGAKSGIQLMIAVDQKATLSAPEGMINELRALPKRGDDAGRIDIPFGAYLTVDDLQALFAAVQQATGGQAFPIAVVSGTLNWASAEASACEPREKIWEEARTFAV